MHIPDGYLGPLTFIVLYAIMIPIWLTPDTGCRSHFGPAGTVSGAGGSFSFVIMMFRRAVSRGCLGHAVGSALVRWSSVPGLQW